MRVVTETLIITDEPTQADCDQTRDSIGLTKLLIIVVRERHIERLKELTASLGKRRPTECASQVISLLFDVQVHDNSLSWTYFVPDNAIESFVEHLRARESAMGEAPWFAPAGVKRGCLSRKDDLTESLASDWRKHTKTIDLSGRI